MHEAIKKKQILKDPGKCSPFGLLGDTSVGLTMLYWRSAAAQTRPARFPFSNWLITIADCNCRRIMVSKPKVKHHRSQTEFKLLSTSPKACKHKKASTNLNNCKLHIMQVGKGLAKRITEEKVYLNEGCPRKRSQQVSVGNSQFHRKYTLIPGSPFQHFTFTECEWLQNL